MSDVSAGNSDGGGGKRDRKAAAAAAAENNDRRSFETSVRGFLLRTYSIWRFIVLSFIVVKKKKTRTKMTFQVAD